MTTQPNIESIAKGLTEAQRKCFKRSSHLGSCPTHESTGKVLVKKGLAKITEQIAPNFRMLDWTPLGLAVRSHLMEKAE